nr:GNAT family N-acetyltransferase [uncultured Halomonas sp.]
MSSKPSKPRANLEVTAPEKLTDEHDLSHFDCGVDSLNEFLRSKARSNQKSKASVTYVICAEDTHDVVGYFSLTVGSVMRDEAPKPRQRRMPDPIPVAVLGRLAIDNRIKGQGIGVLLLRDAVLRAFYNSAEIGTPALIVNALDEQAAAFYQAFGFSPFPGNPLTLIMSLKSQL